MENIEYANILKEYREGLLLFDLMEKEIWNKAVQDSVGVKTFLKIINLHTCGRIELKLLLSLVILKDLKKVANYLKSGVSDDFIKKQLNTDDKQNI